MNDKLAIGLDLGGTNIKGVLIDDTGEILQKGSWKTRDQQQGLQDGANWKAAIAEGLASLKKSAGAAVRAIGLSAPGIANEEATAIAYMPGRLQGLENFHWGHFLKENRVVVMNDAQAALVAESRFGAGKDCQNLVLLTLGTGVGGGILINGKLYSGFIQRAGHLGHLSIHSHSLNPGITNIPGSLEDAVGDATLERRSFGRYKDTHALVDAYQAGDPFASWVWLNTVKDLSAGICSICNGISPEKIILGGGITKAGKSLFDPLHSFMDVFEWRAGGVKTPIVQAKFREFAGAIGAAAHALGMVDG